MTLEEFQNFWEGTNIIRWDRQVLVGLDAPDEVIAGLVDWGLPLSDQFPWLAVASGHNIGRNDHFGRDREYCLRLASPRRDGCRYRTFCFDYSTPICFDTEEDWVVVEMVAGDYHPQFKWNNPEAYLPELRFVNSSILRFLESLTVEVQVLRHARSGVGETLSLSRESLENLEQALRAIDPLAFSDSESFWPVTCWMYGEENQFV